MLYRLLLLPLQLIALISCSTSDTVSLIQGSWRLEETLDTEGLHRSYLVWHFENGHFSLQGYPPLRQSGRYQVLVSEEGSVRLRLFEQSGDLGSSEREIVITLANDTLTIDGRGPYVSVSR
jgi:hypothetical protein